MKKTYTVKICNKEVDIPFTRAKAIRAYCTDCSVGSITEVKECPCKECPLYPFRGFLKPLTEKRVVTDEQREVARQRLQNYHANRAK
jgi:hypothetical protein